jgi:transcriptional regulator with PAS, ATPase and Fis domain
VPGKIAGSTANASEKERILLLKCSEAEDVSQITEALADAYEVDQRSVGFATTLEQGANRYACSILLLPQDTHVWPTLIRQAEKYLPHTPLIVALSKDQSSHIDDLLEYHVDNILILPLEGKNFVLQLNRVLRIDQTAKLKSALLAKVRSQFLLGESPKFIEAVRKIPLISESNAAVLITGDTGVGKELFARAIHYMGKRSGNHFVPLNCSAVPELLFENELFGHLNGAYTGSGGTHAGLVAEANGGSLFLDEINSLSPSGQAKLLRFLEDKSFKMLGASHYQEADVRIISAANGRLESDLKEKRFREDLFYRINVLTIEIPSLRDRPGDIALLADHFLSKYSDANDKGQLYLSRAGLDKLENYSWPGNVRELQHVIEKAVLMCTSSIVRPVDLDMAGSPQPRSYRQAKELAIENFEKTFVLRILTENNWNVSKASECADLDRRSIQRLIRKHHIQGATID